MVTRWLAVLTILVVALMLAQLVPYGRDHSNPPDGLVVAFDSPATERLAQRACFDCHSNRTRWPWYSAIAPISWRIQHHVTEGRGKLNFTAFDAASEDAGHEAGEAGESVTKGSMPPPDYLAMHPEARLSAAESAALAAGLDATFARYRHAERGEGGEGGREDDRR